MKKRGSNRHTVYELLFGCLCTDANGICEEVSLVPTNLGLQIEAKSLMGLKRA